MAEEQGIAEVKLDAVAFDEVLSLTYQRSYIMLHTSFISAQFAPNKVGVEVIAMNKSNLLSIGFHINDKELSYQKWTFKNDGKFKEVKAFFKDLGFTNESSYREFEV